VAAHDAAVLIGHRESRNLNTFILGLYIVPCVLCDIILSSLTVLQTLQSMAPSLPNSCAGQCLCTTRVQAPLVESSLWYGTPHFILHTSPYPIIVFSRSTCPYHCNALFCSTEAISSNPSLSTLHLALSFSLTPHIHLCPFKCYLILLSHRPVLKLAAHPVFDPTKDRALTLFQWIDLIVCWNKRILIY